ncbi:MAG: glycosyltransferase family 2 protein, partial [Candidatus Acidiferrales bacterium]
MSPVRGNEAVQPKYSVVVPLLNEAGSLRELYRRLSDVMTGRYDPVEFIFVDDHSSDATPEILAELADLDERVVFLRLKRNYGQTTALAAGFDHAAGEIVLAMDGDLQHDPSDIPRLIDTLETTDADIVSGWRQKRVDNFFFRRIPSRVANWLMAKLSG